MKRITTLFLAVVFAVGVVFIWQMRATRVETLTAAIDALQTKRQAYGHPNDTVIETATKVQINIGWGGFIDVYIAAAKDVLETDRVLVINGDCLSACTIAASYVRSNGGKVCVTRRAYFKYHQGSIATTDENGQTQIKYVSIRDQYSPDIRAWVDERAGGVDWPTGNNWVRQRNGELKGFYPRCKKTGWL